MQIERGFLYRDGAARVIFCSRVIQQLGFWTQKLQANVDYCYVWRRAECTSLVPGLKHPSLRWLTLFWPRRDVPRHFAWYIFQPSIRAHAAVRNLVWYVATKDARWVRCSCWSLGSSPRRLRSRIVVVFVVQRIDRYSYFCVHLILLLEQALLNFLLIEDANFPFDHPMGRVVGLWTKIWRVGPPDSQIRFYPVRFCKIGLHKQAHPCFRLNKNQKFGIGSHNNQPETEKWCGLLKINTFT